MQLKILIFFLIHFSIYSQERKIIVLDTISNHPIPYVNITFKGGKSGKFCNESGVFFLNENNQEITLSSLGYLSKRIFISDESTIYLQPNTEILDEVIIRNYGKSKSIGKLKYKNKISYSTNSSGMTFMRRFSGLKNTGLEKVSVVVFNDEHPKIAFLEILEANKDGLPGNNILKDKVFVEIASNQKLLEINFADDIEYLANDDYFISITFLNFELRKSRVKLGFFTSKQNKTFFRLYSKKNNLLSKIPNPFNKKFYNLSMELTVKQIKK